MTAVPETEQGRGARRADPYAARVREDLRRVYIRQGARAPLMAFLAIAAIVWILHGAIPTPWMVVWAALSTTLVGLRWGLCFLYSRADSSTERLAERMRIIVTLRVASGLCVGLVAPLWFPDLTLFHEMMFMVVCLGWYATTLVVSLASPISAMVFGVGLLGPTVYAWATHESTEGIVVALLTVGMILFMRQSTENAYAVMRAAIRSRLREEELARGLEQQRAELESAMRAKSQFLAAASHDLRQPVTSMNLLLSALVASRDEASMRGVATKLEAPLQALEEILSTLLEVSRLEAGIVEVSLRGCNIRDIIAPLIAEYAPRAGAKQIRLDASVPDLTLHTDPDLVRRMLRNLLDNAIKFTDRGTVRIEARRERPNTLALSVVDTGAGISWEDQRRVFDDYFQTDNPQRDRRHGLGLGLAIVRRLGELLGGTVTLHSELHRGSRFDVRLPDAIEVSFQRRSRSTVNNPAEVSLGVARVLVVEDDPLVVDAMATLFNTLGVEARFAVDAADAMRQTALGRFIPDLALVDFGLPGPQDGISLVRALRPRLPRCTFLLVTGDTRPEVIRRAADAGVPMLHKPVSVAQLKDKLHVLHRSPEPG